MVTVVVGGVGELYQGDLDLGRHAVDRLATDGFGPHVMVEDFFYGAIAVSQRLAELVPSALVLVGASRWGGTPGAVRRRRAVPVTDPAEPELVQQAITDAGTGYVGIDLVIDVTRALGTLPPHTVAVEVEPAAVGPGDQLSPAAARALEDALTAVRTEVDRAPLLELAGELAPALGGDRIEPSPALDAVRAVLAELDGLAADGRWGRTFRFRDRLRAAIAAGDTGAGLTHRDWGLWWALIEELDRLEAAEAQ